MKKHAILLLTGLSLAIASCKQLLEIPESKSQVESKTVFANANLATAALLGAYYTLGTIHTRMKYLSLYADEYGYTSITASTLQFKNKTLVPDNADVGTLWRDFYTVIYQSNAVLEGLAQSSAVSVADQKQLAAEAKFLRAFAQLNLLGIYDHVPLILSTQVDQNRSALQAQPAEVYAQVRKDLLDAETDLSPDYQGTGKVRANQAAARALLSRLALYQGNWSEAISQSSSLIGSGNYTPLTAPETVFKAGSKESILQLWALNGFLTDANTFIPASSTATPAYPLTDGLYQAFDNNDLRRSKWIGTNLVTTAGVTKPFYYPGKYKNRVANAASPEYIMVLRIAEQYLIRAEAYAQSNQTEAALNDINVIRSRAGLSLLPLNLAKTDCLQEIEKQRRLELFGEWGLRLIDLKRSGKTSVKAFPIPVTEITYNKNLIQNENY